MDALQRQQAQVMAELQRSGAERQHLFNEIQDAWALANKPGRNENRTDPAFDLTAAFSTASLPHSDSTVAARRKLPKVRLPGQKGGYGFERKDLSTLR